MKILRASLLLLFLASLVILVDSCKKDDDSESSTETTASAFTTPDTDGNGIPDVFEHFTSNVSVSFDGDFVVIETDNIPNHGSPYFSTGNAQYEVYNGSNTNFTLNPNSIAESVHEFRIPLNPAEASTKSATPMGAIGISLNGVVFFNQYAAMNAALTNEINSFDQYNGHPQNQGTYHYHIEPLYLTATLGEDVLLGFLLDGFPVYGPMENGSAVSNADLDDYHGHFHVTTDYPNGIYHYHITDTDPYLNGDGFYGTAGTVSN